MIEFSKATKRILVSHTRTFDDTRRQEAQAERAERRKADDAAKDSVKKINASVEKTTLGDISSLAELKAKMESAEPGQGSESGRGSQSRVILLLS